jgi:hypothetical protein
MKDKGTNTIRMNNLYLAILYIVLANVAVWYQLNGHFKWTWFKNNEILVLMLFSMPISWFYIQYQKNAYLALSENLWSVRLVGFSIGLIIFSILTLIHANELPSVKNLICIALAFAIIIIQTLIK